MHSSSNLELSSIQDLIIDKNGKLGQGNYSKVFLGKYLNQTVAVKVCHANFAMNIDLDDSIYSLDNELAVFKAINNAIISNDTIKYSTTSLIQYYCSFANHSDYTFLLVMEYANSGSLAEWIFDKQQTKLPDFTWELGCTVVDDILKGLYTLHQLKFLHRDIKPENIFLNKEGEEIHGKIGDFGLTVAEKDLENADLGGSPVYAAPEVLASTGSDFTSKADIYSFACVMFEMAKRDQIYKGMPFENLEDLKKHVVVEDKRDAIPANAPKNIVKLITLGWMKKPEDRPAAEQMMAVLNDNESSENNIKQLIK